MVFQGDDNCAEEILTAAKEIYQKHGCTQEFLYDWQLLIDDVRAYQKESPHTVHLPKLSVTEAELIQEEMTRKGVLSISFPRLFFMTYIQPFNISIGFLHQVQFRKIQRGKILM